MPAVEAIFRIFPPPLEVINGTRYFADKKTDFEFTENILSNSSSLISSILFGV